MSNRVAISICIPAYKNATFLKRLLDSIAMQTFRNFEVIITDDSPEDEVQQLCKTYEATLPISYFKNAVNLNTPENWNEALRRANGKWIKLIHDDDWFSSEYSLQEFANATEQNPGCDFFFSAYTNVYEAENRVQKMSLTPFWKKAMKNPSVLLADNVIGPPSVTLHRNTKNNFYDRSMKYIVDIDFYIRYLESHDWFFIDKPLINVGINSAQVTKYTFGVAEVHLKEALQLLNKTGGKHLKNILVFDAWWRLIRNFSIKNKEDIQSTGFTGEIPEVISAIISFQQKIPGSLLKIGPFSKAMMSVCYLASKHTI
jgi:glycosyltransferase involved in cell wall biosynthesis